MSKSDRSGKIRIDKNGVREDNNRPSPRNTVVNWPAGGPKPIRRRDNTPLKTAFDRGRSGKF